MLLCLIFFLTAVLPKKSGISVLLTFDDGYKDNYNQALPIIKMYDVKCIFFIVTNYPDTNNWLIHDKIKFLIHENIISENILDEIKSASRSDFDSYMGSMALFK